MRAPKKDKLDHDLTVEVEAEIVGQYGRGIKAAATVTVVGSSDLEPEFGEQKVKAHLTELMGDVEASLERQLNLHYERARIIRDEEAAEIAREEASKLKAVEE